MPSRSVASWLRPGGWGDSTTMAGVLHLVRRFFRSIRPGPPPPADEAWARGLLNPGEVEIWQRMSNPDRRHAVMVARAVVDRWPADLPAPDRPVLAAALLHDSGKVLSGFRTPARVAATLVWAVVADASADRWLTGRPDGLRARLARYRRHPELGAEMLRAAGSDPLTASWAAEHHRPEARWTVPVPVGRVLKACDDD